MARHDSKIEIDTLKFTKNLAWQAGKLILKYYRSPALTTELKADFSPVTQADHTADAMIHAEIHASYPTDLILSEESATILEKVDRPVWVIDPLDGTINFATGTPIWGVSIARIVGGFPEIGVIYFPVIDELYSAERGNGAWLADCRLDQFKQPLTRMAVICSRTQRRYEIHKRYKLRMYGAVSYNMALVARKQMMFNLELQPRVWDFAAGWLIVEESGGVVHVLEGETPFPLQPGRDYSEYSASILAASSIEEMDEALEAIKIR